MPSEAVTPRTVHANRPRTRIPGIGEFWLPVTRNDLLLLMVALMLIGLGVETYLAHLISGDVKPMEFIPVVSGPVFGLTLLGALLLRLWRGTALVSTLMIIGIALASIAVGVIGSAFHWTRAIPSGALAAQGLQWEWLVYAPPIAGPLSFAGVGLLAIIAVLEDTRPETGRLTLPGVISFRAPMTQTRQFLWLVALGLFAATLSAFLDHGRTGYTSVFVWIPVVLGLFGSIATTVMAIYHEHHEADYFIFFWTMLLMVGMGVLGLGLHINADLPEGGAGIQLERFVRGAPVMAPMLFALVGTFGLITMIGAETVEYPALPAAPSTDTLPEAAPSAE